MCYRDLFSQDEVIRKVPNIIIKKKNTQANLKKNPKNFLKMKKSHRNPAEGTLRKSSSSKFTACRHFRDPIRDPYLGLSRKEL